MGLDGSVDEKISTGSKDLDEWLGGGYEKGIITLLHGPAASGKSNLVMLACCGQLENKKVVFVDSEGSFSVERIKQISESFQDVLKRIVIFKPLGFYEQGQILAKLLKDYKSKNLGLVVVDSMVMFYRLEMAEARKKGLDEVRKINYYLINQMKSLNEIAVKKEVPVLITTHVYSDFSAENSEKENRVNVVGGDILKYWSKCIIELQNKNGKKKAVIRKHRSLPEKEIVFEIYDRGIRKREGFRLFRGF